MSLSQFQYLVERYISDESTSEEMELLRELLKKQEYGAALDTIMDQQLAASTASSVDYPEMLNRLKLNIEQQIASEKAAIPVKRMPILQRRVAVAATIILLLSATGIWLLSKGSSKQKTETVTTAPKKDIAPGKAGAVLTLDDGRTMVLDSLGNGVIAMQNGTKVLLKNGELIYNKEGSDISQVAYNTMTTPKGRQFQLILPDGSKVWLNAASSLRYPTLFTGKERRVEVTGEAYFEVAKNPAMPFRVKVNDETEIEVLGTHFNVNSYNNESNINTTLLEGTVQIVNAGEKAIIKPGQQAQVAFASAGMQPHIKIVSDVNVEKVMAWKNGVFDFEDASLEEVMRQLERWYDIDVVYEKGVPKLEFMGKMGRDLALSDVLHGLEVSKVHCRLDEGRKLVVLP